MKLVLQHERKGTTGQHGQNKLYCPEIQTVLVSLRRLCKCTRSLSCESCSRWVHKRINSIFSILKPSPTFRCKRFTGLTKSLDAGPLDEVTFGTKKLEVIPSFRYAVDTLVLITGCRVAWYKINKPFSIITALSLSPSLPGESHALRKWIICIIYIYIFIRTLTVRKNEKQGWLVTYCQLNPKNTAHVKLDWYTKPHVDLVDKFRYLLKSHRSYGMRNYVP